MGWAGGQCWVSNPLCPLEPPPHMTLGPRGRVGACGRPSCPGVMEQAPKGRVHRWDQQGPRQPLVDKAVLPKQAPGLWGSLPSSSPAGGVTFNARSFYLSFLPQRLPLGTPRRVPLQSSPMDCRAETPAPRPLPQTSQSRACCCAAFIKSQALGMSWTVRCLRIHLSAGDGGLIPGRGSESPPAAEQLSWSATAELPQRNQRVWRCEGDPKIPRGSAAVPPAATKTQHNQITKYICIYFF